VKIEWYVAIDATSFGTFQSSRVSLVLTGVGDSPDHLKAFLVATERDHYSKVLHNIIGVTMPEV
jgi:hypothetical protein